MKSLKHVAVIYLLPLLLLSCLGKPDATTEAGSEGDQSLPSWIMQGNIYEVNVRQYTPEGTLSAFAGHLDRLEEMSVQTVLAFVREKGNQEVLVVLNFSANQQSITMDDPSLSGVAYHVFKGIREQNPVDPPTVGLCGI